MWGQQPLNADGSVAMMTIANFIYNFSLANSEYLFLSLLVAYHKTMVVCYRVFGDGMTTLGENSICWGWKRTQSGRLCFKFLSVMVHHKS